MKAASRILPIVAFVFASSSPSNAQEDLSNEMCLECHSDQDLTRELLNGEVQPLFVDPDQWNQAVHGMLSCADCHSTIEEIPHNEWLPKPCCRECHDDSVEEFSASDHGKACAASTDEAPSCVVCHGDIHVFPFRDDEGSPIHPARQPETCGECHSNPEVLKAFGIRVVPPLEAYRASVHARAVTEGRGGATCSDCHGGHNILPGNRTESSVSHQRVAETCGTCHSEIMAAYRGSIHARALDDGVREAPTCTDCHGEHRILSPQEEGSPVYLANMASQSCGHCHNDLHLSEKYGLSMDRVPSYNNSYHGLAVRSGRQTVASCASCHGVHDILPSSDPDSHVNIANLPDTCGQCHPGAGRRFAIGPVHVIAEESQNTVTYFVRLIYLPLIFLTIGGMAVHNLMDFIRKSSSPQWRMAASSEAPERMMRGFRVAHLLVVISFPVLVYTGFALKYPEAWWAQLINFWEAEFDFRGWVHRAAGVVLLAAIAYHLIHLMRNSGARACIWRMRPSMEDLRELKERVLYYLGRRKNPPHGVELGYVEKSEYLAFMWGTIIMALTGFLLWFENFTLEWLPSWVPEAATAVHFYEAILASLAILVWHFYWVIFDPAVYPMDASWITGKAPVSRELERRGSVDDSTEDSQRRTFSG